MEEKSQATARKFENPFKRILKVLRHPFPSAILHAMYVIILFSICLFVSYRYWITNIGDGAYKYSDETYTFLESNISNCCIENVGIDALSLQQEVTSYTSSYENGTTTLTCKIVDGSFTAEVSATLDETFKITHNSRNFNSIDEYMGYYWHKLGVYTFVCAVVACLVLEIVSLGVLFLFSFAYKKLKAKKEQENPADADSAAKAENTEIIPTEAPVSLGSATSVI